MERSAGTAGRCDAPAALILATDLDGTFAGGSPEDRRRLQRALREAPDTLLLYVTGRSVRAARTLMQEADLPQPDVLISDVGTTVLRGADFGEVDALREFLSRRWPDAEVIRERLAGIEGIEEQDVHAPRRVSYWLRDAGMEETLERVERAVRGLGVDVIGSADHYVDVLPGGVNKGSTLLEVLDWLNQPRAATVVAGDTLNDLALFQVGLRGIIVGNAEPELKRRAGGLENIYVADAAGAAGILEGLIHFDSIQP